MPQVDLSRCPECGYDLRGLPPPHRCPECGFEYDEFTRVWKPRRPALLYLTLTGSAGFVWLWIIPGVDSKGWADIAWLFAGVLWAIVLAYQIYRCFVSNRRGRYIAVVPCGILVRTVGNSKLIPWTKLRGVLNHGAIQICLDDDARGEFSTAVSSTQLQYLLDTPESRAEFEDWVNEAQRRYAAHRSP